MSRIVKCEHCGKEYRLGYTGMVNGCDRCLGISRDTHGHPWYPGETHHEYKPVSGGNSHTVKRSTAMRKRPWVGR